MKELSTTIYSHSSDLPDLPEGNFFHSKSLFLLLEQSSRQRPYMAVVKTSDGGIAGCLLAIVRHRMSWIPPFVHTHCHILGEGHYTDCGVPVADVFAAAMEAITRKLHNRVLYIEVSNLTTKMFGYRTFRELGYFPVHWMSIHNSLHSHNPIDRLSERTKRRIESAYNRGVVTKEVDSEAELHDFYRLLKSHNRFKLKRYIPDEGFFRGIVKSGDGRLFVTKYHGLTIGCCACAYSGNNAYLWYSAFLRKSFVIVHPDLVTVWHAIRHAYDNGYEHIEFLDVGLPFRKNPFREFILRFGGKPVSTYRWFRISFKWLNGIFSWIYRN